LFIQDQLFDRAADWPPPRSSPVARLALAMSLIALALAAWALIAAAG
jgi:hypothetical protein